MNGVLLDFDLYSLRGSFLQSSSVAQLLTLSLVLTVKPGVLGLAVLA